MPPRTRIQIARQDIIRYFDERPTRVYSPKDLAAVLSEQRASWRLTQAMRAEEFTDFLVKSGKMKRWRFPFPRRREERFAWGEVPFLEIVQSLKPHSYFCHYTAVRMHGLTEQLPKTIFVNFEQAPHSQVRSLSQDAVDAAFSKPQRQSGEVAEVGEARVCLINGMNTNMLGVEQRDVTYDDTSRVQVRLTSLERTLIDIAVRPAYAGGVHEVQKAYELARGAVSVNRLVAMLQKLQFTYPYHQAIGFYMVRAEYKPGLVELLRQFPMSLDFYLAHDMGETDYVKEWRLYIPKGF